MTNTQGYMAIFQILDDYFFTVEKDRELAPLLGQMNPELTGGRGPADPAVWEDWLKCVEKVCGKADTIAPAQLRPLLFAFLEMYRDEWGFDLNSVILALRNDPNLDSILNQYASREEQL